MALIRTFARMDAEGKIQLPRNVRVALDLKEHDVVEIKVGGPGGVFQKFVPPLHRRAFAGAAPRGRPKRGNVTRVQ